jgi:hypothetical protein
MHCQEEELGQSASLAVAHLLLDDVDVAPLIKGIVSDNKWRCFRDRNHRLVVVFVGLGSSRHLRLPLLSLSVQFNCFIA